MRSGGKKMIFSFHTASWTRWHLQCLLSISHVCFWVKRVSCVFVNPTCFFKSVCSLLIQMILIFLMYWLRRILSHKVDIQFALFLISLQLRQLLWNSPHLSIKTVVLHQLMLVTAYLWDVLMKVMLRQSSTGINKLWDRNQESSPPSICLTEMALFIMNSTTILASHWTLKTVKITWRSQICTFQTQLLTTVLVAI